MLAQSAFELTRLMEREENVFPVPVRTVMNNTEATRIPRPAAWSSTRVAMTFNNVVECAAMPELLQSVRGPR